MTPSNDIEDRFASAVKHVLEASAQAETQAERVVPPTQDSRPRGSRRWAFLLLYVTVAVIAAVVVAAVLHVRSNDVARLASEIAAFHSGSVAARSRYKAPSVAESPAPDSALEGGPEPSLAASGATTRASPEVSPGAEISSSPVPSPASTLSGTPASTPGVSAESQSSQDSSPTSSDTAPISGQSRRVKKAAASLRVPHAAGVEMPAGNAAADTATVLPQAAPSKSTEGSVDHSAPADALLMADAHVRNSRTENFASPVIISSPDHSVYWAFESSGIIFRSTDRKSWQKLDSGVQSDLLAGTAPSNTVCWAVGRRGTILLTTDGTRWQPIKSPITTDIISVSALSADVADIVGADGSRLSTFDRGSNWMPTD